MKVFALAALLAGVALCAHAEQTTVCTITVNSPDEREAFRRHLPVGQFRFVELLERGRRDWLASACRQQVRCDVLIVSGHFAGVEFYSSKLDVGETLKVGEIERVQCSESCPGLFSQLKEVYLFGCDSLKPEPVRSASPEIVRGFVRAGFPRAEAERMAAAMSARHGEASRDLMRRLFPNVPVIYGFSSLAPYGRVAGPMLDRYFDSESAGGEVGSGRASERLLGLFGPASMKVAAGMRDSDPDADFRAESCRYFDDRITQAQKLRFLHGELRGDAARVRMYFERIERFFGELGEGDRKSPSFASALAELVADAATRERYLGLARETEDPALRVRMVALGRSIGWLSPAGRRAELARMVGDMLSSGSVGYGEVDLICTLNKDGEIGDGFTFRGKMNPSPIPVAAARACLGSAESRAAVLKALASPREQDVQIAQAYLRHRPITDSRELRAAAQGIARMGGSAAQARALETLARHRIADRGILEELARMFRQSASLQVQRAIAEIFIRSGAREVAPPGLADVLRRHRLRSSDGGRDLIDELIDRL